MLKGKDKPFFLQGSQEKFISLDLIGSEFKSMRSVSDYLHFEYKNLDISMQGGLVLHSVLLNQNDYAFRKIQKMHMIEISPNLKVRTRPGDKLESFYGVIKFDHNQGTYLNSRLPLHKIKQDRIFQGKHMCAFTSLDQKIAVNMGIPDLPDNTIGNMSPSTTLFFLSICLQRQVLGSEANFSNAA